MGASGEVDVTVCFASKNSDLEFIAMIMTTT